MCDDCREVERRLGDYLRRGGAVSRDFVRAALRLADRDAAERKPVRWATTFLVETTRGARVISSGDQPSALRELHNDGPGRYLGPFLNLAHANMAAENLDAAVRTLGNDDIDWAGLFPL